MKVGIGIKRDLVSKNLNFQSYPDTKSSVRVSCYETIEELRSLPEQITGLLIPASLPGADYRFGHFVELIRVDKEKPLAELPIVVVTYTDDEYLDLIDPENDFSEDWYKKIGVVVSYDPKEEDFDLSIDTEYLRTYRRQVGIKPDYAHGRHDRANHWGAYLALRTMSAIYPGEGYSEVVNRVENELGEETYFKKKIQKLNLKPSDNNSITSLKLERSKLLKLAEQSGPILIVEDQLEDGWKDVYKAVFASESSNVQLVMVEDAEEAKSHFDVSYGLVLLDVRLSPDRDNECQNETGQNIDQLSGVKLARWIKSKDPTLPIIAATASNKSWTLKSLMKFGATEYWVKDSPETSTSLDDGVQNLLDLFKKLNSTLKWSLRTRLWISTGYNLASVVSKTKPMVGERLLDKAKSIHALLHRAPSPFSNALSSGLQQNMAFLELFSCVNDLVTWLCEIELDSKKDETNWYTLHGATKELLVKKRRGTRSNAKYEFVLYEYVPNKGSQQIKVTDFFHDSSVVIEFFERFGLEGEKLDFRKLNEIRNALPLIHGKLDGADTTSKTINRVTDDNVNDLVGILNRLVNQQTK